MRSKISRVTMGCAIAVALSLPAAGPVSAGTELKKTTTAIVASGPVAVVQDPSDGEASISGPGVFKYFKMKDGKWVLKRKSPAVFEESVAFDEFQKISRKGKCKVVSIFKGNETYAKSKGSIRLNCKTGQNIYK